MSTPQGRAQCRTGVSRGRGLREEMQRHDWQGEKLEHEAEAPDHMDPITKDQMIEPRVYTEGKGGTEEFYAVLRRGCMSQFHFRMDILVTVWNEAGGDP